jgi:hypothetical protein
MQGAQALLALNMAHVDFMRSACHVSGAEKEKSTATNNALCVVVIGDLHPWSSAH